MKFIEKVFTSFPSWPAVATADNSKPKLTEGLYPPKEF